MFKSVKFFKTADRTVAFVEMVNPILSFFGFQPTVKAYISENFGNKTRWLDRFDKVQSAEFCLELNQWYEVSHGSLDPIPAKFLFGE